MKKLLVIAALTAMAASLALAQTKAVVEGEKYTSITAPMKKTASSVAAGGAFVEVPLKRPHGTQEQASTDGGKAVYSVNIPVAGSYRFWGRTHWHDGCGNSFFLKIGSKPEVVFGQDGSYNMWKWRKGPVVELPKGVVQVVIRNREDGAKIDQFMFTRDLKYVPVRAERATQ